METNRSSISDFHLESSQLSSTFLDGLRPLAESSAIKVSNNRNNATYSILQNPPVFSPAFKSPSSNVGSLNVLNLDSLPSKLFSLSTADAKTKNSDAGSEENEGKNNPESVNIRLNDDELRDLEEAFSDLSTGPRDTGAIATSTRDKGGKLSVSNSLSEATNVSSLPSLSLDSGSSVARLLRNREDNSNLMRQLDAHEDQENLPPYELQKDAHFRQCELGSHSETFFYGRPLSTIAEWQSRESFSSTTAYQGRSQSYERTGEVLNCNETPEKGSASVFKSVLPGSYHSPRKSGILQSSHIANSSLSPIHSKIASSTSQVENAYSFRGEAIKSGIFDRGENTSCRLPAHLLSPPTSPSKFNYSDRNITTDDMKTRHHVDYGGPGYFIPGVGYWYTNQLSKPPKGEEAKGPQDPLVPVSKSSLLQPPVLMPPTELPVHAGATPSTSTVRTIADNSPPHQTIETSMAVKTASPPDDTVGDEPIAGSPTDTYAIATHTISHEIDSGMKMKDTKTTCEVDLKSSTSGDIPNSAEALPITLGIDGCAGEGVEVNISHGGKSCVSTRVEDKKTTYPLMATSRCLFWRACTYGHESKQQFVLRQDSDRLMRVKLQITEGKDFFTLLDHRGRNMQAGSRLIELPPRLACTVTVVYTPRPPLFWHTGILAFRELSDQRDASSHAPNTRCYLQRLIGYVAGSNIQCNFCRGVDEKTYWTSAFSTPTDSVGSPCQKTLSYYARVSIMNAGLRTAWVFAVAMRSLSDQARSPDPLPGVRVAPARFVLRPSQSRDVVISIANEPLEVLVLFYNGDEILRHQCRKILASVSQCEQSPPRTLPRPHRRLRSAYIMRPFEGESLDMSSEISFSVSGYHYNWHEALQDEQRSRPPLSLTIYPLLTEASTSSFETSSCLIIDSHVKEESHRATDKTVHLSTTAGTLTQVQWSSEDSAPAPRRLTSLSLGSAALAGSFHVDRCDTSSPASLVCRDARACAYSSPDAAHQPAEVPLVILRPDSQLIFAPCQPGLFTSATLQIELTLLASSRNGEGSGNTTSSTTSSRRRLSSLWRLYWRATPVGAEGRESVFSYLVTPRPLLVEPGETHYLPFSFRPPRDTPPDTRFSEAWLLFFHLSRDITGPLLPDSTFDGPTQEAEILFVGDTLNEVPPTPPSESRLIIVKSLLRLRGSPVVFKHDGQQCRLDLINVSREERLIVSLGQISSPVFELIRPKLTKFSIEPRSSVRLSAQFRREKGPHDTEIDGFLPVWWSTETDQMTRFEESVPFKAIL